MREKKANKDALTAALESDTDASLLSLLESLQMTEVERSATNLRLLDEGLADSGLLTDVLNAALLSADPDSALNQLER